MPGQIFAHSNISSRQQTVSLDVGRNPQAKKAGGQIRKRQKSSAAVRLSLWSGRGMVNALSRLVPCLLVFQEPRDSSPVGWSLQHRQSEDKKIDESALLVYRGASCANDICLRNAFATRDIACTRQRWLDGMQVFKIDKVLRGFSVFKYQSSWQVQSGHAIVFPRTILSVCFKTAPFTPRLCISSRVSRAYNNHSASRLAKLMRHSLRKSKTTWLVQSAWSSADSFAHRANEMASMIFLWVQKTQPFVSAFGF